MAGHDQIQVGHRRARVIAHDVPLTAGEDDQIAGPKPDRLVPGQVQPARAGEDQVELGHAGPVHLEPPWLAQFRQAVNRAANPHRRQQLGDLIVGRGIQQPHGRASADARTTFLSSRT